jgi:hypothetical protein
MASNEMAVQNAVCEYLALKKHFFFRMNNTPISDIRNGQRIFRAMPKYGIKGLPDIQVLTDGGFTVFLEIKDKSKQSDDQKEFERRCKEVGCEYHIIRSIDDVQEIGL